MVKAKLNGVDFTFNSKAEIKSDFIIDYCAEQGDVKWIKTVANKPYFDKQGNARQITYIELLNEFVNKYEEFAEFRKKEAVKKPTFLDRINSL